ncbi:TPA: restriction endonuclease subunit S, partial [Haemophilus influenzae]
FTSFNVGTGVPTLNRNHLSSILISDLGIEKEKEIANILGSLDQKIQLNTQINQTLEQIAQALFKSWFVDFDPVRAKVQALSDGLSLEQAELAAIQAISGKTPEELTALSQTQPERYAELAETAKAFPCEMVEVDGVEVPKGWEVKALDEIANYQNGLALQKFRPEDDEPFLPVVKIAQLRQGYADGDEKAKANIKLECIIDNGDVIFSWSGSLLVDIWCGGKAALNQHLFKVSSKEYPKWFYYFYTKHHLTEFQRIAYDKAVTMGHIKREHLSAAKCIVPNDELLANKTLENILEKIIFNRLENFNLQNTRDLLLPRLLNGELNG